MSIFACVYYSNGRARLVESYGGVHSNKVVLHSNTVGNV